MTLAVGGGALPHCRGGALGAPISKGRSARKIGDYIVGKTLGTGSTGHVRLARHSVTGTLVALKIIRNERLVRRPALRAAVRREIAIMRLVACAGVPKADIQTELAVLALHHVYETPNATVLALEYCPGGDLFELLVENGCLPLDQVHEYFVQLVRAIEYCHRRGVCHRDLKPENILITKDGRLKVADFGMAGLLNPLSLLETSCGSPQYCAPEVISGELYCGTKADVWSLGVILFAMTTGGLPFDDDNLPRLMRKVCSGMFFMPPEVPADLADLIRGMLAVDPEVRLSVEDIIKSAWFTGSPHGSSGPQTTPQSLSPFMDNVHNKCAALYCPPVPEPDAAIIRLLSDLGLGDAPTIRRRLIAERPSLEQRVYYQFVRADPSRLETRTLSMEIPGSPPGSRYVDDHPLRSDSFTTLHSDLAGGQGLRYMPQTPSSELFSDDERCLSVEDLCISPFHLRRQPEPPPVEDHHRPRTQGTQVVVASFANTILDTRADSINIPQSPSDVSKNFVNCRAAFDGIHTLENVGSVPAEVGHYQASYVSPHQVGR